MYIVWRKTEYDTKWERFDCANYGEMVDKVLEWVRTPATLEVTVPVPWRVSVELLDAAAVASVSPEPPPAATATDPEEVKADETP